MSQPRTLVACALLIGLRAAADVGTPAAPSDVGTPAAPAPAPASARPRGSPESNVKSLDTLKEELQKNNDDYRDKVNSEAPTREATTSEALTNEAPTSMAPASARPAPVHRRVLDAESVGAAPAALVASAAKPKKYARAALAPALAPAEGPSAAPAASRNPKYVKKNAAGARNKMDKLRNFLDKYKVIVSEFMANHSERAPPRRQQAPALAAEPSPWSAEAPAAAAEPSPWNAGSAEAPVLRAKGPPPGLGARPPSAAELDMSPARGGAIHSLRNKNRLCHRHVMIPEGPKYDSKGRVYLGEYTRLSDRDYANTRKPRLLLPKCCNCCRKSVLGCE